MINGDSRHEERIRALEEFAAISTELAELMEEGRAALEEWTRELEERQQTHEQRILESRQRIVEVERRQGASRSLLQRLLDKAQEIDARVVQLESE